MLNVLPPTCAEPRSFSCAELATVAAAKRLIFDRKATEAEATAAHSNDPLLRQCWIEIARKWRLDEAGL